MPEFGFDDDTRTEINQQSEPAESTTVIPRKIGRYRVTSILGSGGFGMVYLARDEQLNRQVAIKVPHTKLTENQSNTDTYLTEARTLAGLDHPGIVPVYDVGASPDFPCYFISKYVEGQDLSGKLKKKRLDSMEAAKLVVDVADALHYAHKMGLVHRDIKPGNILIDNANQPFIVDFGLALREENVDEGLRYAGTLAYMSPEQARGEGHRVDGRTDIFSLGVVLYELLVGKRPFRGKSRAEVVEQITKFDPRPPRQCDEQIPQELERICLKAISKRLANRYSTARDMADDLRMFMSDNVDGSRTGMVSGNASDSPKVNSATDSTNASRGDSQTYPTAPSSDSQAAKIVPKGLRSFDEHDADFFLTLLPGPRDREGLTSSLRFWKTRVEEPDADNTFSVGTIYGPSGCGKSSLVKAGLLPLLSENVTSVYIEATAEETESRLLNGLRKRFPDLDQALDLKKSMIALRQKLDANDQRKVLIVIDQFEQWLHARQEQSDTELVAALRQCDGANLQCIVMVRDDFWMAVTRFNSDLELSLIQGENFAPFDLFPIRHAQQVLAAFGRAYGALPVRSSDIRDDQKRFIEQVVDGLAENSTVICVRLALFAEMMKGKSWTPSTLKGVGGTEGIGVTFLDETFSARTNPTHKLHKNAARMVLKALLPDSGANLKGQMKSYSELLVVSGYQQRPADFERLIRILDGEMRLITPTDPAIAEKNDLDESQMDSAEKYYQLTHDYLVPSLRQWLNRKQKETRKGRAELALSERTSLWVAKPENRHLPSWMEHIRIRLLTGSHSWTVAEQKMMGRAAHFHGLRTVIAASLVAVAIFAGIGIRNSIKADQDQIIAAKLEEQNKAEASRLVDGLLAADTSQVATTIRELRDFRKWADPELRIAFNESPRESNAKLHAAMALSATDQSAVAFLARRVLDVSPFKFEFVRDILDDKKSDLIENYWRIAQGEEKDNRVRFRAAAMLAGYDSDGDRWEEIEFARFVAERIVDVLPSEIHLWRDMFRSSQHALEDPLIKIFLDTEKHDQPRVYAAEFLSDYVSERPADLFLLLEGANEQQFDIIFEKLRLHKRRAVALGIVAVNRNSDSVTEDEKEQLAHRMANSAIALLKLGESTKVWPLFRHQPDPRLRSMIIHQCRPRSVEPDLIATSYEQASEVDIKRAMLLTLGEYSKTELAAGQLTSLIRRLKDEYWTHPDAGLHAAIQWLFRKWELEAVLVADDDNKQLAQRFPESSSDPRNWYVNSQGKEFVILDAGEVRVGSPETEAGAASNEAIRVRRIGRHLAFAAKEVTKGEWTEFATSVDLGWTPDQTKGKLIRTNDSPIVAMTWYEAAHYCNWLSELEDIPEDEWCYEKNDDGEYGPGMRIKEECWKLTGYRLPTESEWEFACRADSTTSRYYGQSESLLTKYAWHQPNSDNHVWPVGRLKPNDFGLFDMQGNAYEWCHDVYRDFEVASDEIVDDQPETGPVKETVGRVCRGGGFKFEFQSVRSATRYYVIPNIHKNTVGIRLCRTIKD